MMLRYSDLHTVNSAVKVVCELKSTSTEEITQVLMYRSLVFDATHGAKAISFAASLGLLSFWEGGIHATEKGVKLVNQEEIFSLRELFKLTLLKTRRDLLWIAYLEESKLAEHDPNVYQITKNLKLWSRKLEKENLQFWNDLKTEGKYVESESRAKLGRIAEEQTVRFEEARLRLAGLESLSNKIRWLSQDSDLHGYDILSFRGQGPDSSAPIHIEVKSASHDSRGRVFFYLTRNEYDQAIKLEKSYFFYIWRAVQDQNENPLILDAQTVINKIPIESEDLNTRWTERIFIL